MLPKENVDQADPLLQTNNNPKVFNWNNIYNMGNTSNQNFIDQINSFQNKIMLDQNTLLHQYYNNQINQNNYFNFNVNMNTADQPFGESNENEKNHPTLKSRKKSMPSLDIDSIKNTDTSRIFNECLMNSYNLYTDSNQKKIDVIISNEQDYPDYTHIHTDLNVNNQL